jgi:uncharacterized protein (TIGR00730 family)
MHIKKPSKKVVSSRRSSLRNIAAEEKQAAWELSDADIKRRIRRINEDFSKAFKLLRNHTDTVTFFGSARFDENNEYYQAAREIAQKISRELGLTVVSGGGPGIMEAANRGAREACQIPAHGHETPGAAMVCGQSLGLAIELPTEQKTNPYVHHSVDFYYFFSRKVALAYAARAFICFPGGFGTLDEFFEVLTLKQTHKIPDIPIILYGTEFWKPLLTYIDKTLYQHAGAIHKEDMKLYTLTDDFDEIVRLVDAAKIPVLKSKLVQNHKKTKK